jgi:hypothetical protein
MQRGCVQELILTARYQRTAKLYKEAAEGKLNLSENVERRLKRARSKHEKMKSVLEGIAKAHPECAQEIHRALMHHMSMQIEDIKEAGNDDEPQTGMCCSKAGAMPVNESTVLKELDVNTINDGNKDAQQEAA